MSSTDWISLLAIAEFAALLALVLVALLIWIIKRRRRDTAAATGLITKLRNNEPERRAELQARLVDSGMPESEARELVLRLLSDEHRFYEQYLATYLDHDAAELLRLDERLRALVNPYLALTAAPVAAGPATEEAADRAPEIDRLRQAVRNLSEEMSLYRETLNRVFSEHTAMFGVKLDPRHQLTATEILQRLESGALGGDADAEATATEAVGDAAYAADPR